MPFQLFLEKMRQPLAAELVSGIKHFINTFVLEEDKEEGKEGEEEGGEAAVAVAAEVET